MKKFPVFIIFACVVLFTVDAFGTTLKIATLSPDGSFWVTKMREGGKEVRKKTEGRVRFKFYPGGVMGDDRAVLRKMRIGQLQGGAVVAGTVGSFFNDSQIYALPFIFRSFGELDFVRKQMDQMIIDGLEKNGLVVFGLAEGGFAYLMSQNPVRSVEELRSQKVWVPDNDPTLLSMIEPFDIKPILLSMSDVRAGLQTGLINAVAAPPVGMLVFQWQTQVKYLMNMPFLYIYAVFAVDKKAFSRISEADQKTVREIMGGVFRELDKRNREDNIKALEALKKQGIDFIDPPKKARDEWRTIAETIPENSVRSGRISKAFLKKLREVLNEYRSAHPDNP